MLRLISILTIMCYSVCFIGCGENEGLSTPSVSEFEKSLREDSDVRELLAIRDEMITRALESGVTGEEMAQIVQRNDQERFASTLGYTEEELLDLGSRVARLGDRIRNRYPKLAEMAGSRAPYCAECGFNDIAEKWDNLLTTNEHSNILLDGDDQGIPTPDPADKGVNCQWTSYTASLVLCTAFGFPLYFACAIIALCQFCTGGWVTGLCQQ